MTPQKYKQIQIFFKNWFDRQWHWQKHFVHRWFVNPAKGYIASAYTAGFQHGSETKIALAGVCLNCDASFELTNSGCMDLLRKEAAKYEARITELEKQLEARRGE